MKDINIYVLGKKQDKYTGTWTYYLNYKEAVIKRTGVIREDNNSELRTTLYALYHALNNVKEPCRIKIYSKRELGFKNIKNSVNHTNLLEIQAKINSESHIIEFIVDKEFKQVDIWEEQEKQRQYIANNPNDVFRPIEDRKEPVSVEKPIENTDWRAMYSDLMCDSNSAWVPGSGGY